MMMLCRDDMKSIDKTGSKPSSKQQDAIDKMSLVCPIDKPFDFNSCRIRHLKARKEYEKHRVFGIARFNFCKDCELILSKIKEHAKLYCKDCRVELKNKRIRRGRCRRCYYKFLDSVKRNINC